MGGWGRVGAHPGGGPKDGACQKVSDVGAKPGAKTRISHTGEFSTETSKKPN